MSFFWYYSICVFLSKLPVQHKGTTCPLGKGRVPRWPLQPNGCRLCHCRCHTESLLSHGDSSSQALQAASCNSSESLLPLAGLVFTVTSFSLFHTSSHPFYFIKAVIKLILLAKSFYVCQALIYYSATNVIQRLLLIKRSDVPQS